MSNSASIELEQPRAARGTRRLLQFRGVSVFVHWSLPLALVALAVLANVGLEAALPICVAYISLLALHEVAHAVAARRFGLRVHSLTLSAFGGLCRFDFPKSYSAALAVVSAGVMAQLFVLIASQTYVSVVGEPSSQFGGGLLLGYIYVNAVLVLLNLVPKKQPHESFGTDGYLLWEMTARKLRGQPFAFPDTSITFAPDARLAEMAGFNTEGFTSGIEIFNDNATPMEFVVSTLSKHLDVSREEALKLTLTVHTKGGHLFPMPLDRAEKVIAAIAHDAAAAGHPLLVRVARMQPGPLVSEPRIRPPWSGQKAGVLARILAAVFVLLSVTALLLIAIGIERYGIGFLSSEWNVAVTLVLSVYAIGLCGRVMISGRAPKGWLPWQ